jgi:hypothetical protein
MPQPQLIFFSWDPREETTLGGGVTVPKAFTAHLRYRSMGPVDLDIVVEGQRARVVALRANEASGLGITGMSIAQISIQRLLDSAVEAIATIRPVYGDDGTMHPSDPSSEEAIAVVRAATRRRISEERLAGVLEAAEAGGVEQVMAKENVGERQAFRLIKRAKQARGGDQ